LQSDSKFIPDSIRLISLQGVDYYIDWESMDIGSSFFLKTVAPLSEVRRFLSAAQAFFNIELRAQTRCEFGYYGIRVWRMA